MRRSWLVILSWCVGFVWAVALILNATGEAPRAPAPMPIPMPAPPTETAVTESDTRSAKAKYAYVGNTNSKKFHDLKCRYADCTNCKVHFATRQEAVDAGFDPCGTCKP
jgi:hypothetical protein